MMQECVQSALSEESRNPPQSAEFVPIAGVDVQTDRPTPGDIDSAARTASIATGHEEPGHQSLGMAEVEKAPVAGGLDNRCITLSGADDLYRINQGVGVGERVGAVGDVDGGWWSPRGPVQAPRQASVRQSPVRCMGEPG